MDESVDYEKQGAQAIQDNWQIYKDDESWTDESQSRDERDVVTSKQFAKWGKVFRLTVSIDRFDPSTISFVNRVLSMADWRISWISSSNVRERCRRGTRRCTIVEYVLRLTLPSSEGEFLFPFGRF